jgi:hypothetical protein
LADDSVEPKMFHEA